MTNATATTRRRVALLAAAAAAAVAMTLGVATAGDTAATADQATEFASRCRGC